MSANRPKQTGKRPAPRTAFGPGQSGNPSGRPAVAKAFRDRCREFMERDADGGWTRLESMALLAEGEGRDQFAALQLIAAYAYGKPTQVVAGEEGGAPIGVVILPAVKPHGDD